jgi:hypothetical protein
MSCLSNDLEVLKRELSSLPSLNWIEKALGLLQHYETRLALAEKTNPDSNPMQYKWEDCKEVECERCPECTQVTSYLSAKICSALQETVYNKLTLAHFWGSIQHIKYHECKIGHYYFVIHWYSDLGGFTRKLFRVAVENWLAKSGSNENSKVEYFHYTKSPWGLKKMTRLVDESDSFE